MVTCLRHVDWIASSTSSFVERRAGISEASTPSTTPSTSTRPSLPYGRLSATFASAEPVDRVDQRPAHEEPEDDAGDGAERGDEDRFEAHHALHALVGHPHGAQEAELAAALVDRERERVDDPDQRDDDAHHEQAVHGVDDEVEDLADQPTDEVALPER